MDKPKVSVCVITCNQKKYIRECLESLVTQKTNFPLEIIVGDDASTDGTEQIVKEYANKYPKIIKTVLHKEKVGGTKNYFSVHNMAQGEYVAHLDGDDYALQGKLQIQSDFLDENPDCDIVGHQMNYIDFSGNKIPVSHKYRPLKSNLNYLLKNQTFFCHSSKMYRLKNNHITLELLNDEIIDFTFHIYHALQGNIGYLNQELGVYRQGIGISSNNKTYFKRLLLIKQSFMHALDWKVSVEIVKKAYFMFLLKLVYAFGLDNSKIKMDEQFFDKNLLFVNDFLILKTFYTLSNFLPQTTFIFSKGIHLVQKLKNKCQFMLNKKQLLY